MGIDRFTNQNQSSSASGYLSIGDDLTIETDVVIQVMPKGSVIRWRLWSFNATGNASDPVLFEGQGGATWKGLAFTAACSTGTDERHILSYVDFANTADAAIAAGSRHGAAPSSSGNVWKLHYGPRDVHKCCDSVQAWIRTRNWS